MRRYKNQERPSAKPFRPEPEHHGGGFIQSRYHAAFVECKEGNRSEIIEFPIGLLGNGHRVGGVVRPAKSCCRTDRLCFFIAQLFHDCFARRTSLSNKTITTPSILLSSVRYGRIFIEYHFPWISSTRNS